MSEFSKELKRELIKAVTPQGFTQNPLLVLGFSPELLELGLTDDELFKVVQRVARSVLASFHPDVAGLAPATVARQRKYAEIFEQVGDFDTFRIALQELKDARALERSDTNTKIRALENQLDASQVDVQKMRDLKAERDQAVKERHAIARRTEHALDWQRMSFGRDQMEKRQLFRIDEVRTALVLRVEYTSSRGAPQTQYIGSVLAKNKHVLRPTEIQSSSLSDLERDKAVHAWDRFLDQLRHEHLGSTEAYPLIERALHSPSSFPEIHWDEFMGFSRYPAVAAKLGRTNQYTRKPVTSHGPSDVKGSWQKVEKVYRESLRQVWQRIMREPRWVSALDIRLMRIELGPGGVIRNDKRVAMGSLAFADISPHTTANTLIRESSVMAAYGIPFLVLGEPIVTSRQIERKAWRSHSPEEINRVIVKSRNPPPLHVNHVLIAVEEVSQ